MNHEYQEDLVYSQETIAELKLQIDNHKREITELTEDLDKVYLVYFTIFYINEYFYLHIICLFLGTFRFGT
jgi:hypothetical protein